MLHLRRKARLGYGCFTLLIRLRLRFLSALRLLAGRFGVRGTEDPIDLRSPRGYDLSLLARSRACHVSVSAHARARSKEQAAALRPTPCQRPRTRSSSLAQNSASFRPPPPLLHPLDNAHFFRRDVLSRLAKEAYRGLHTVSERRRDGCCSCAVVIRPVPVLWIRGWFA